MPEPRLAFKAGRAFRREGTNFVDPNPAKGAVLLVNGDDDLLHFQWKSRVSNEVEEVRVFSCKHLSELTGILSGFDTVSIRCLVREGYAVSLGKNICLEILVL